MRNSFGGFVALVCLLTPAVAGAATVTFDDILVPGLNDPIVGTRTSNGFDFTSTHWHVINHDIGFLGDVFASDGTQYMGVDLPVGFAVTMTKSDGGAFALGSFFGAEAFVTPQPGLVNAQFIQVTGHLLGGGIITDGFALDGLIDGPGGAADFQEFLFRGDWFNLTSVVWSGMLFTGAQGSFAVDNIVATPVPEPATWLGVGTGLLAVVRRRTRLSAWLFRRPAR